MIVLVSERWESMFDCWLVLPGGSLGLQVLRIGGVLGSLRPRNLQFFVRDISETKFSGPRGHVGILFIDQKINI